MSDGEMIKVECMNCGQIAYIFQPLEEGKGYFCNTKCLGEYQEKKKGMKICPRCNHGYELCRSCNGGGINTGGEQCVDCTEHGGYVVCSWCKGSGEVPDDMCEKCGDTGIIVDRFQLKACDCKKEGY